MRNPFKMAAQAIQKLTLSKAEKLGLPKGFPVEVSVYQDNSADLKDLPQYLADALSHSRFYHAMYQGGDTWHVADFQIEPDLMGSGIEDATPPRQMNTQQVIALFDQTMAQNPAQPESPYLNGAVGFKAAREQLLTLSHTQPQFKRNML